MLCQSAARRLFLQEDPWWSNPNLQKRSIVDLFLGVITVIAAILGFGLGVALTRLMGATLRGEQPAEKLQTAFGVLLFGAWVFGAVRTWFSFEDWPLASRIAFTFCGVIGPVAYAVIGILAQVILWAVKPTLRMVTARN